MGSITPYVRGYSFSGWQANNPQKPLPGQKVDEELDNLQRTTHETIDGLNQIRRADGKLNNGIVTIDALAPEIQTGVKPTVLWQPSTQYDTQATVSYGSRLYRCLEAHVSQADFADDLAAGRWQLFADFGTLLEDTNAARDQAVAARDEAVPAAAAAVAARDEAVPAAAAAVAAADAAVPAAAAAVAAYDNFDDRWLGDKAILPTTDNDGNPLVVGAQCFLLGVGPHRWNGTGWDDIAVNPQAIAREGYAVVAVDGATSVAVVEGYVPGQIRAYVNGSKIRLGADPVIGDPAKPGATASDGANIVFPAGYLLAGDLVEWVITKPFQAGVTAAIDVTRPASANLASTNVGAALLEIMASPDFSGSPKKAGAALATESYVDLAVAGVGAAVEDYQVGVSASAGALTLDLLNSAGATPTVANPVAVPFGSATGGVVRRTVSAALSLTIPSGATLGVAALNTAFSVWFLLFDDGGTPHIAAVQCRVASGGSNRIRRLRMWDIDSAVLIDAAADNAGVIYAGAAIAAKTFVVLGKAEWDGGLAALGTWTAPTRYMVYTPGMPLPGDIVQQLNAVGSGSGHASTTMTTGTGGSQAITLSKPCNAVKVRGAANGAIAAAASGNPQFQASLFRDSTDLTTTQTVGATSGAGGINQNFSGAVAMQALDFPNTAAAVTYSLRHRTTVSGTTATTSTINLDLEEICA